MAKGNFWTRSVRGRLGDMVFYKANGEQMTRSYNGNPANPRTDAQLMQRAKWVGVCNAYAMFKPFIAETFIKRPQDQNNFNAFVSANVGLSPVVGKLTAEDGKKNVTCEVAPYVIANGTLSGFPKSRFDTFIDFPTEFGSFDAGVELAVSDNVKAWVNQKLGEDSSVVVPFGDFYKAIMADQNFPNSHIAILVATANESKSLSKYFYWEFFDGANLPDMTFSKNAEGVLQPAQINFAIGTFNIMAHFLPTENIIHLAVQSDVKDEYAAAVFRCEYAPTINTERASLVLSPALVEHLAEISDPVAVADAIASYRRSASAEDEQVFHG